MPSRYTLSHGWHVFEADRDIYCRQREPSGIDNRWELENRSNGKRIVVDDSEFDKIRQGLSIMYRTLYD
jgi:hypothetical protein